MTNSGDDKLEKILDIVQRIDKRSEAMDKRLKLLEKEQDDMQAIVLGIPDIQNELEEYLVEIKGDVGDIREELEKQK